MKNHQLINQSIEFSISMIQFYNYLIDERKEFVISKQLLRSATSIGANIHEAKYAVSRADFINKMQISLKECSETEYWLIILERTGYLNDYYNFLKEKCISIKKMLVSSIKTLKEIN